MAPVHLYQDTVPTSSPAFSTPVPLLRLPIEQSNATPSVLPIVLSPAVLRPVAFRVFTKKHNLNLTSSALDLLAQFIGKNCGAGWREGAVAEKLLDDAAKQWKKSGKGVLIPGEGDTLVRILDQVLHAADAQRNSARAAPANDTLVSQYAEISSMSKGEPEDPRTWMTIVSVSNQPRLFYDPERKHFEHVKEAASCFPNSMRKNAIFSQRYNLVHQRVLRTESFQTSAVQLRGASNRHLPSSNNETYKLTMIANLLGRGGSQHLLLGLLARSPAGYLTLNDPTGSIVLDLQYAQESYENAAWFTPGMILLADGQYADAETKIGAGLNGGSGIGGTINGTFLVFGLIGPPSERREYTLGISGSAGRNKSVTGAGFGWVDFLGVGSEKGVGQSMRLAERRLLDAHKSDAAADGRASILILGEVNLDVARTIRALRKVLAIYSARSSLEIPMAVVLMGNFISHAGMAGTASDGSVDYKEHFDALASTLSDYPSMLHSTTFVFVPGDNDPWASAYSAGATTLIPRAGIPEIFTTRVRRAFALANAEYERATGKKSTGEAVWSSNPARITFCGPTQEIVIFRDDISGRFRRNAVILGAASEGNQSPAVNIPSSADIDVRTGSATAKETLNAANLTNETEHVENNISMESQAARKLVKTVIDQGYLSPFPLNQRPVHWEYANALNLYPLPTALVLMDTEASSFITGLDGCHVMNPGPLTPENRKGVAQWMEYDLQSRRGSSKICYY